MWDVEKNYTPKITQICPICRKKEDATELMLDCEVELKKGKHTIGSCNIYHWKQILKIFRDNKNKRKAQTYSTKKKR